jgi:hypothetical protein
MKKVYLAQAIHYQVVRRLTTKKLILEEVAVA